MHRDHQRTGAGRHLPALPLLSLLLTGLLVLPACRGDRSGTDPTSPDVGSIEVAANTTGEDPDPNGYAVTLDGSESRILDASGTATFSDVAAGSHELTLSELARNCQVDGANPRSVSVTAGMTASTTFGVSCTRLPRLLFVSDRTGNTDVWKTPANGTDQQNLSDAGSSDTDPRWSPDGTRVAFVSDRDGQPDVFVMDADGTDQRNLSNAPGSDTDPRWSPDGSEIAFVSDRNGQRDVFVMNADGTDQRNLSSAPGSDTDPRWSPDGSEIAFVSDRDGSDDVWVMAADGTEQDALTVDPGADTDPRWSPDGSRVAFVSDRDGSADVFVISEDGSDLESLTSDPGTDTSPRWEP